MTPFNLINWIASFIVFGAGLMIISIYGGQNAGVVMFVMVLLFSVWILLEAAIVIWGKDAEEKK